MSFVLFLLFYGIFELINPINFFFFSSSFPLGMLIFFEEHILTLRHHKGLLFAYTFLYCWKAVGDVHLPPIVGGFCLSYTCIKMMVFTVFLFSGFQTKVEYFIQLFSTIVHGLLSFHILFSFVAFITFHKISTKFHVYGSDKL